MSKKLMELMYERKNNLDLIRFIAASLVLLSHSYPLTNFNKQEPLGNLTKGQVTFGELAVAAFFIISGFLITQSYERSKNPATYFKARVLRIFPGLLVAFFITAFAMGPIFTNLSIKEYFTNPMLYKYFIGLTLLPNLSPTLPGLFVHNPFGPFVNGSLWTLKFEFIFYIAVAILGNLKLLKKNVVGCFYAAFIVMSIISFGSDIIHNFLLLGSYFLGGMLAYLFRKEMAINGLYGIISLIILLITARIGCLKPAIALFGTYIILLLGYNQKIRFNNFSKYGDFSYGLYIFAFPIQQIITQELGSNITPIKNALIAFPITLIFSFISWHLVEKRALKLKNLTFNKQISPRRAA